MKPLRIVKYSLLAASLTPVLQAGAAETECCQPTVLRAPMVLDSSPARVTVQPWPVAVARYDFRPSVATPPLAPTTSPLVLPPPPSALRMPSPTIVRGQSSPGLWAVPVTSYRPITTSIPAAPYRIGKGLVGQPKLYVPGQPMRNFLRYLSL